MKKFQLRIASILGIASSAGVIIGTLLPWAEWRVMGMVRVNGLERYFLEGFGFSPSPYGYAFILLSLASIAALASGRLRALPLASGIVSFLLAWELIHFLSLNAGARPIGPKYGLYVVLAGAIGLLAAGVLRMEKDR